MTAVQKLVRNRPVTWGLGLALGLVLAQVGLGLVEGLIAGFTNGL